MSELKLHGGVGRSQQAPARKQAPTKPAAAPAPALARQPADDGSAPFLVSYIRELLGRNDAPSRWLLDLAQQNYPETYRAAVRAASECWSKAIAKVNRYRD